MKRLTILSALGLLAAYGFVVAQPEAPHMGYHWAVAEDGTPVAWYIVQVESAKTGTVTTKSDGLPAFDLLYAYNDSTRLRCAGVDTLLGTPRQGPWSPWSEWWVDGGPPGQPGQPVAGLVMR